MEPRTYPDLIPAEHFARGAALVLAPHPDDEVAACGGLVAHHVDAGHPVEVAFLTDGARGSWRPEHDPDYVALREQEALASCAVLGTRTPRFLRFPDGRLSAKGALVAAIRELITEVDPAVVYCPSFFEIHNDHREASHALLAAVPESGRDPLLMLGEIGVPLWANVLVDISSVFERKLQALRCYESQLSANDYVPALQGLDRYRTVNIDRKGVDFVEAYLAGRTADLKPLTGLVDRIASLARAAAGRRFSG